MTACERCGTTEREVERSEELGVTLCGNCFAKGDDEAKRRRTAAIEAWLPERTDLGNAELFALLHADRIRHVRERREWLHWRDGRWRRDTGGEAERAAKATARERMRRAIDLPAGDEQRQALKWALASQSESRIRATLSLAATEPEIVLGAEEMDADPWLLGCGNGTLDLRTGELREAKPGDLISIGTDVPFDPDAGCPRWLRFLEEVFRGDEELIGFFRRFSGYSLTGDTREHVLVVFHGLGGNGKTTLIEIEKRMLGQHAVTASFDSFHRARGDRGPRNDLARLHRARRVVASESGEGRRLDEATVKQLTGGDTVTARFLYGEHFEFKPQFKLVLVTNHRPRVAGDDEAIWRRLRLVPFEECFTGREDRDLAATLEAELPGILAWAVEGCLEWQRLGLGEAEAVTRATREYREDEDTLGAFLAERCILGEGEVVTADLREAYEGFCGELGERPLGPRVLGKQLARRGVQRGGTGRKHYVGVRLTHEVPSSDVTSSNSPRVRVNREVTDSDVTHGTQRHSPPLPSLDERERAGLALAQQLVDAGEAEWVEDDAEVAA